MVHGRLERLTSFGEKLVDHIQDVHAMKQNFVRMLDSLISTTGDPEIRDMLEHHKGKPEEHERRLRERLDVLGGVASDLV